MSALQWSIARLCFIGHFFLWRFLHFLFLFLCESFFRLFHDENACSFQIVLLKRHHFNSCANQCFEVNTSKTFDNIVRGTGLRRNERGWRCWARWNKTVKRRWYKGNLTSFNEHEIWAEITDTSSRLDSDLLASLLPFHLKKIVQLSGIRSMLLTFGISR